MTPDPQLAVAAGQPKDWGLEAFARRCTAPLNPHCQDKWSVQHCLPPRTQLYVTTLLISGLLISGLTSLEGTHEYEREVLRAVAQGESALAHVLSVALLTASVVVLACSMLVSCSSATTTDPQAAQQAHARASLTAGARATQTAMISASQTVAAIPLIPLPYAAAAPGPSCDTGGAVWTAQTASGVSCLAQPARLRLTALPDASGNCCQNEVDWSFGQSGKLPATYRVNVELSGLLGQKSTGQITAALVVNLRTPSGDASSFTITFYLVPGSSSNYNVRFDGPETGFVSYPAANFTKSTSSAIEVDTDMVKAAINGTIVFTRSLALPYTVTGIALTMSGPSGDTVEFSNLQVEAV